MPQASEPVSLVERDDAGLAAVLRERALATSTPALLGQLAGGIVLNAAALWWHPGAWPIPVLTGVMLVSHAIWAIEVRRAARAAAIAALEPAGADAHDAAAPDEAAPVTPDGWLRGAAAVTGMASLFGLFAALGVGLLGRLIS